MADKWEKPPVEEPDLNTEYEPYKNRNLTKATNDIESLAHITKGIVGTGILTLPYGFKCAGLLMGFIYSTCNGVLATIGMHILAADFHLVCKAWQVPVMTYTNAMRYGLKMGPPKLRKCSEFFAKLTDVFIVIYQIGVMCVYILFVAVSIKYVIDSLTGKDVIVEVALLIMVFPAMAISAVKNLKMLVPLSYISLVITCAVIVVVFYYIFRDPLVKIDEREMVNDFMLLPQFFGTTLFAFTSVPVVVSVENNMRNAAHFHYVYDISIIFLGIIYLTVGFFGYWKYGNDVYDAVNLNFPTTELLAVCSNIGFAIAIFISLGLHGIVPVRLLYDTYMFTHLNDSQHKLVWEYLLRLGLVALSFFMAATVPYLGEFISLLGSVALSHLAFMFPCLIDICARYQVGYGRLKWRIIIDIILILYGFVGLTTGVYVNVASIINKKANELYTNKD